MYDLSARDWGILRQNKWVNSCGWKGWFNFSRLLDDVKYYPNFDNSRFHKFTDDIDAICDSHDIDFARGWNIIDFTKANFLFGMRVFKKLHWTSLSARLASFLIIITGLTFLGRNYFRWWKKRSIKYLLNNKNESTI